MEGEKLEALAIPISKVDKCFNELVDFLNSQMGSRQYGSKSETRVVQFLALSILVQGEGKRYESGLKEMEAIAASIGKHFIKDMDGMSKYSAMPIGIIDPSDPKKRS